MENKYFIFDFDSTFIQTEGLEELFELTLKNDPQRPKILEKIQQITNLGMEGKLGFRESLEKRIKLLKANQDDLEKLNKILKKKISKSIINNKMFFKKNHSKIYIVSGGFKEFVMPIARDFGIVESHVLGNTFLYDKSGNIIGFDKKNPCSKTNGKAQAVAKLGLDGEVVVIGDGITDLQIRDMGYAKKFIAFTENVDRQSVVDRADGVIKSLDEFLYMQNLPQTVSYPKSKIKVLLLENIDQIAVEKFRNESYQVEEIKRGLSEEELLQQIKGVSILGIRSKTKISAKVVQNADKLIAVGTFTIGIDQMDLEALAKKGVVVFNAPYQNTRSVVELALGEMVMLLRGVFDKSNKMHQGIWDKSAQGSNEIRGKTLGIIGYGNIGSQLSVLAESIGMNVIYYDLVEKLPLGNAKRISSMEEVLRRSDVVSIHVSGTRENSNIIGDREFAVMKQGAVFLNLSRGFVVDLKSLKKYLEFGKLRGAALDVFPDEPKGKADPFESDLKGVENVILTPHIAGSTEEAQRNIGEYVSQKLVDFVNTGNTFLSVNLPEIQLPHQRRVHRLLHIHKNVPGILAQINQVLAINNINVEGQYLKTNEMVGYVITDVNEKVLSSRGTLGSKKYDAKVLEQLKKIDGTIRFRVLY